MTTTSTSKLKTQYEIDKSNESKANRDPITHEPGSHPIATTVGTAVGIATGVVSAAAVGAVSGAPLGPVGMVAGAVAGGIFGGGVGHAIGEDIYPTQIVWWKENYRSRPYVNTEAEFEVYEPAYKYGIETAITHKDKGGNFDNLEPSIRNDWNLARGDSSLEWDEAKPAARDAYERVHQTMKKPL